MTAVCLPRRVVSLWHLHHVAIFHLDRIGEIARPVYSGVRVDALESKALPRVKRSVLGSDTCRTRCADWISTGCH